MNMSDYFYRATARNRKKVQQQLLSLFPGAEERVLDEHVNDITVPEATSAQEESASPDQGITLEGIAGLFYHSQNPVTTILRNFLISDLNKNGDILSEDAAGNISSLIANVLDPVSDAFGSRIRINSGYRSNLYNLAVGGVQGSQHTTGEAVDLSSDDNRRLFKTIYMQGNFDQLIWENKGGPGDIKKKDNKPQWVHVSHSKNKKRGQVLVLKADGTYRQMTKEELQSILS